MTTMNTGAASLSDEQKRAAITACALMIKGICLTTPNAEWTERIENRIHYMLRQIATTPQADAAPSELASMTRMFHAACADLGAINEALGLDPDDGGAAPILDAIAELKSERDKWVDAGYAASANASQADAAIAADGAQEAVGEILREGNDSAFKVSWLRPPGPNGTKLYAEPLPRVAATVALTDDQIVSIWEGMPDGASGFRKSWGYMQFARALLAASNGEQA